MEVSTMSRQLVRRCLCALLIQAFLVWPTLGQGLVPPFFYQYEGRNGPPIGHYTGTNNLWVVSAASLQFLLLGLHFQFEFGKLPLVPINPNWHPVFPPVPGYPHPIYAATNSGCCAGGVASDPGASFVLVTDSVR